jgi:hypothetical protein
MLTACEDKPSPLSPIPPASDVRATNHVENDLAIANRFDLDVGVEGSLKPGHPIHLTLRGTANFAAKDADVRLSLPEVAAAEKSGWDVVEIPVGEETRPHVSLRRSFSAGERFHERTTISIPEPGYYFVMATAKQYSNDSDTDRPNLVGDVSGKALWLWIDERGGRVTEKFDTTLFAPDMRKERGPRTHKYKAPRTRKKGAQIACTVYPPDGPMLYSCPGEGEPLPPPPPPTATHSFSVEYDKAGGGHVSAPVPGIRYVWRVTSSTGYSIATSAGFADANGNIPMIDCQGPTSERNVQVDVFTINDRVEVLFGPASTPAGRYTGTCGGSNMVTANMYMAQAFLSMLRTVEGHYRAFGQPVPRRIPVSLNETGATHYFYSVPEIRMYASYQILFGEFGAYAAAHEWGHMWHDKYLIPPGANNGLIRYYSGCPTEHTPAQRTTLPCAFGEAFANWYAVVVREGEVPTWKQHLEENYHHKTCQNGSKVGNITLVCVDDGSIVEGAIHSFLYDLSDGTQGETHDQVQFTPLQVASAVGSCTVRLPNASSNIPYKGVDHLIYCMEGRAPYMVRVNGVAMTFFNTRPSSEWPQSALGSSLALSSDQLRKVWLVNLYSKRPGVGNNPTPASMDQIPGEEEPLPEPEPEPDPCYTDENGWYVCPIR